MHRMLFFAALLTATTICASDDDPWQSLATVNVDQSCFGVVTVRYDRALAVEVPNRTYVEPESQIKSVSVMTVRPAREAQPIVVEYSEGPSCDPGFVFYRSAADRDAGQSIGDAWGLTLIIPGDGFLYLRGHTNNWFDQTRKYAVTAKGVEEVRQPFAYAGITTKAVKDVRLLSAPSSSTVVASIAAGSPATVVLCNTEDWCLVKDRLGLLGWVKLAYENDTKSQFEGVFFAGD